MTTAIAFDNASRVMMSRAVMPWRNSSTTACPAASNVSTSRRLSTAGGAADPGSDMPIASATDAIVFAV